MKNKFIISLLVLIFCVTSVFAVTRNSYTKYGKHLMPTYYDPWFITNFENCEPTAYVDWTGTYRYIIEGIDEKTKLCKYKTQYNPWLKINKNAWEDYKICNFNEVRMKELTGALKEHSNLIRSYDIGAYKTTGTKVEYLLYSYEYYGACKYVWKGKFKDS